MQVFTTWCLYIAMIVFVSRHHASIYNMVLVHCNDCVCVRRHARFTTWCLYIAMIGLCRDAMQYLQHGACTLQ